jgi:putative two-component system response regulator
VDARLHNTPDDLDGILARLSASRNPDEAEIAAVQLLEILKTEVATPSLNAAESFRSSWLTLSELPPECAGPATIECLLNVAHFCYLSNRSSAGLQPALKATSYARKLDDKRLLRRSLSVKGVALAELGDMPRAIDAYSEALSLARELGDPALEGPVWINLGTLLMQSAQYADALKSYQRAVSIARGPQESLLPVAYSNLGSCALQVRDSLTGLAALRRAIELNDNPSTAHECVDRVMAEANYAHFLLRVGDLKCAEEHSQAASLYAKKSPNARAEYVALQVGALVDVYAGRFDIGLTRLKGSLEYAREHIPSYVRKALSICSEGHEAAGQPDVALLYLHKLQALNREAGAAQALIRQLQEDREGAIGAGQVHFEALLAHDTARLRAAVDARLRHLINAAIDAGLASGYDLYRVFRISTLAEVFAAQEGCAAEHVRQIALAAKLIDIGMIATPQPLLTKAGCLSEGERKLMDDHTRFGAELLAQASLAMLQPCIPMVRFHHERWDGSGPWSLKGEAIPLEARLVALCDAFDAMTHPRPWRTEPLTPPMALREIAVQAGRQFDPKLAARFVDFVQHEFWKNDRFLVFLGDEGRNNDYVQARERIGTMMRTGSQP